MSWYLQTTPEVPGESEATKHENWIQITGYSQGVRQNTVLEGSTGLFSASGAVIELFSVDMDLNKAVPVLVKACFDGKPFNKITIDLCTDVKTHQPYMQYVLTDVLIADVNYHGAGGGNRPSVSVAFAFRKMEQVYTQFDFEGKPLQPVRSTIDGRTK